MLLRRRRSERGLSVSAAFQGTNDDRMLKRQRHKKSMRKEKVGVLLSFFFFTCEGSITQ